MKAQNILLTALILGLGANVGAQTEIKVSSNITTSTTWTANKTYNLQKQIFVMPGATLTIQAGTVIASTTNLGGSLAITRGAQIHVQGSQTKPVIMTSKSDVATWTGGNPRTGRWREAANEWGNLTIMGRGYISANKVVGNKPAPNANNIAPMEGLVASKPNDPNVIYGGGNDDDDSGSISYLSLRYGGKVIALNNELNGLSLGGVGRGTDISHIEIMNNVDDGIEIWGGAVNIKYFSIWNVGDDSFDVDQGWRGKAQFGLLVQGYSLNAKQGSGVGDNAFETDGAEDSNWQPVTTTSIYNCTVIGQPFDGDGLTAWRDNARIQYRNCVFMDCGEKVVRFDNKDGDGASGYGFGGTLSWPASWTTNYNVTSKVNAPSKPANFYKTQTSGKLCEITDSVFYHNKNSLAYTEATARGVFAAANGNVKEPSKSPIRGIIRGTAVVRGGKAMVPVTSLDPRPANDALTSKRWAPADGFYTSAHYRGAFSPDNNWLNGWTASEAFGLTVGSVWHELGSTGSSGAVGQPVLSGTGTAVGGQPVGLNLTNAKPSSPCFLGFGFSRLNVPFLGATLVPNTTTGAVLPLATNAKGELKIVANWPTRVPKGAKVYFQYFVNDSAGSAGAAATNGLLLITP